MAQRWRLCARRLHGAAREHLLAEAERAECARRKGGQQAEVRELARQLRALPAGAEAAAAARRLQAALLRLPNRTHPAAATLERPRALRLLGAAPGPGPRPALEHARLGLRREALGAVCGARAYFLSGALARLEEALLRYTVAALAGRGFRPVAVPDVLPARVLSACGAAPHGLRTQVYTLDPAHHGADLCLSGTAEMSLAGLLQGRTFLEADLPHKMVAVSRCYRAETSNLVEQRGIYRVHQFTKVEMFVATRPEQSDEMLEYLRQTQEELFSPLGLHMRVLDMPPEELGAPAYRKYDIEAWLPGRGTFGEISSCSNCTDYQSRRLQIKYAKQAGGTEFVHTLNGTACAVPRMLIALVETHQQHNGTVDVPHALRPFISQKPYITKTKCVPELKLLKLKHK